MHIDTESIVRVFIVYITEICITLSFTKILHLNPPHCDCVPCTEHLVKFISIFYTLTAHDHRRAGGGCQKYPLKFRIYKLSVSHFWFFGNNIF